LSQPICFLPFAHNVYAANVCRFIGSFFLFKSSLQTAVRPFPHSLFTCPISYWAFVGSWRGPPSGLLYHSATPCGLPNPRWYFLLPADHWFLTYFLLCSPLTRVVYLPARACALERFQADHFPVDSQDWELFFLSRPPTFWATPWFFRLLFSTLEVLFTPPMPNGYSRVGSLLGAFATY